VLPWLELQIGENRVVRGMVESDRDYDGRTPLLIIDGREISWDEFGRMLMSFEDASSNSTSPTRAKNCEPHVGPRGRAEIYV
jgi:hypothetical protein